MRRHGTCGNGRKEGIDERLVHGCMQRRENSASACRLRNDDDFRQEGICALTRTQTTAESLHCALHDGLYDVLDRPEVAQRREEDDGMRVGVRAR